MQLDVHPKKVRAAIVLVTLALCAFFLAKGVTSWAAAKWLPASLPSAKAGADSATAGVDTSKGARPPDPHDILARNIFDPTTGSLWPPKEPDAPKAGGPEDKPPAPPALAPGEMPPGCEGQARLVATIFSPRLPEWSFASVAVGTTSPLLYRIGNQVDGKQVDSVYPEAVFLKTANGALCSLTMFRPPPPPKGAAPAAAPAPPPDPSGASGSSLSEAELDQNIHAVSETKYTVQRGFLDKVLTNQAELMRAARVVPHEENGHVVGVKLYGIRRTSLLGKLGLQNGDLLRTINGFDMSAPDTALEAYAKLRTASNLAVSVVRRGSAVTMEYQVGNN